MSGRIFALVAAALASASLMACSGSQTNSSLTGDASGSPAALQPEILRLPRPAELAASLPPRTAAEAQLVLRGSAFEPQFVQRVAADDDSAVFSPAGRSVAEQAYALYRFNLAGYEGIASLRAAWSGAPLDDGDCWLGLANWPAQRWDWYKLSPAGAAALPAFAAYQQPASGELLAVLTVLGEAPCALSSMGVGDCVPFAAGGYVRYPDGQPVKDAIIDLGFELRTQTDAQGHWQMAGLAPGQYTAVVSKPGCGFAPPACEFELVYSYVPVSEFLLTDWFRYWYSGWDTSVTAVAVDGQANTYVLTYVSGTTSDAGVLLKYDCRGELQWAKTTAPGADVTLENVTAQQMTADAAGNSYLSGYFRTTTDIASSFIAKLSPDGELLWCKAAPPDTCSAGVLVAAPDGGIVMAAAQSTPELPYGMVIEKLDAQGSLDCLQLIENASACLGPKVVRVDAGGNISVCGRLWLAGDDVHAFLLKTASQGQFLWARSVGSGTQARDDMLDIAVDAASNIYAACQKADHLNTWHYAYLQKISPQGQPVWQQQWGDGTCHLRAVSCVGSDLFVAGNEFLKCSLGGAVLDEYIRYSYLPEPACLRLAPGGEYIMVAEAAADEMEATCWERGNLYAFSDLTLPLDNLVTTQRPLQVDVAELDCAIADYEFEEHPGYWGNKALVTCHTPLAAAP